MEQLATNQFMHSEYLTSDHKDILAIHYYANKPQSRIPRERLTMTHLAVIIKYSKYLQNPENYQNFIINPNDLSEKAIFLIEFIDELNYWHLQLNTYPLRTIEKNSDGKTSWMLKAMKARYPNVNENQLQEGYELTNFLVNLRRGIHFEESYLTGLKIRFDLVPLEIKVQFITPTQ